MARQGVDPTQVIMTGSQMLSLQAFLGFVAELADLVRLICSPPGLGRYAMNLLEVTSSCHGRGRTTLSVQVSA